MQTVSPTSTDDFISGDVMENTEIFLRLYSYDELIEDAHIKFQDNMTLGLDPGYEGDFYQGQLLQLGLLKMMKALILLTSNYLFQPWKMQ